ncbi:MAG: PAS domain-containing protein, partial [Caulobacteraceae bacterium]|nr:PAS domain-containing protein [Caulobacteraceae bacterium]
MTEEVPEALILAPDGRDAEVARALLRESGTAATIAADLREFAGSLSARVAFAVVTEEALSGADLREVATWVSGQPSWSDLPFIVLVRRGGGPERNPAASRLSEVLGNATFVERPFHPTTFVSVARSALRQRGRQYEARGRIQDLFESEQRLRTALEAGRLGSWELEIGDRRLIASDSCKAVFGRTPSDAFTYGDLLGAADTRDREALAAALDDCGASGVDCAMEVRTVWPDASKHWAEIRARRTGSEERDRDKLIGVCSDISERKSAEEQLRGLNE